MTVDPALVTNAAIVVGVGVVAAAAALHGVRRNQRSELEKLCSTLQFTYEPPDIFGRGATARGTLDGVPLQVQAGTFGALDVYADAGAPEGVRLYAGISLGDEEQYRNPTGDDEFNRAVTVRGTYSACAAALDHAMRERLRSLAGEMRFHCEQGKTIALIPAEWERVAERLRLLAQTLSELSAKQTSNATMIANIAADPISTVRRWNFVNLLADGSPSEIATGAKAALLDPELAKLAKIFLPESFTEILLDPAATAKEVVAAGEGAVSACLRNLMGHGPDAMPLIRALWTRGGPAELLAIEAIGKCGGIDAVPLLRAREDSLFDRAIAKACDEAIAMIQARAAGTSGGVSLAEGTSDGAVSLAAEAGEVSLAKKQTT